MLINSFIISIKYKIILEILDKYLLIIEISKHKKILFLFLKLIQHSLILFHYFIFQPSIMLPLYAVPNLFSMLIQFILNYNT